MMYKRERASCDVFFVVGDNSILCRFVMTVSDLPFTKMERMERTPHSTNRPSLLLLHSPSPRSSLTSLPSLLTLF